MIWNICGVRNWAFKEEKSVLGDQSKELRAQDDNPKVTFIFDWFCIKLTFSKRFWRKWEHILRLINTKVTSWLISSCILRPDVKNDKVDGHYIVIDWITDSVNKKWGAPSQSEVIRLCLHFLLFLSWLAWNFQVCFCFYLFVCLGHETRQILVLWPETDSAPLQCKHGVLIPGQPGSPQLLFLIIYILFG